MSEVRRVLVVGTGLLGTSLALALTRAGAEVQLADVDNAALATAVQRGAGQPTSSDFEPELVAVAVPPAVTAAAMIASLDEHPRATVMDVASVKAALLAEVREGGGDLTRVVGTHPMAGREVSGPGGATADLFEGRVWVVSALPESEPWRIAQVREVVAACGGSLVELDPADHDRAVALTSHAPQVISSLLAGLLADAPLSDVAVSGQGLRDLTRIAASDPVLWTDILSANAGETAIVLDRLSGRLADAVYALSALAAQESPGQARWITDLLAKGNAGRAKIPGKHGETASTFAAVVVSIEDRPGELGRLFNEIAAAGVSVEDVRIDHAAGRPTGLVEISVAPQSAGRLIEHLSAGDWQLR